METNNTTESAALALLGAIELALEVAFVAAAGVTTWDAYRGLSRSGRTVLLSRKDRKAIWHGGLAAAVISTAKGKTLDITDWNDDEVALLLAIKADPTGSHDVSDAVRATVLWDIRQACGIASPSWTPGMCDASESGPCCEGAILRRQDLEIDSTL